MPKYQLNQSHLSTAASPTGSVVKASFEKGDVIDGVIIESGSVSTNNDGTLPDQNIVGKASFQIPLSKLTKVDDNIPVFIQKTAIIRPRVASSPIEVSGGSDFLPRIGEVKTDIKGSKIPYGLIITIVGAVLIVYLIKKK